MFRLPRGLWWSPHRRPRRLTAWVPILGLLLLGTAPARAPAQSGSAAPSPARSAVENAIAAFAAGTDSLHEASLKERLIAAPGDPLAALGLAALARLRRQWDDAAQYREQARAGLARDDVLPIDALGLGPALALEATREAIARGRFGDADERINRTVALAQAAADSATLADVWREAINVRARTQRSGAAAAAWDSVELVRHTADPRTAAMISCTALTINARREARARGDTAMRLAGRYAATFPREAGACADIARLLYGVVGEVSLQASAIDTALRLFQTARDPGLASAAATTSAALASQAGQYNSAKRRLGIAASAAVESEDLRSQLYVAVASAEVAVALGEYARADEALVAATLLADETQDSFGHRDVRRARVELAMVRGEWDAARRGIDERWSAALGVPDVRELHAAAQRRADLEAQRGDLDAAWRWVLVEDSLARVLGPGMQPSADHHVGWIALLRGQTDTAIVLLARAREGYESSQSRVRFDIGVKLANAWALAGDLEQAAIVLTEQFAEYETWRAASSAARVRAQLGTEGRVFGGERAQGAAASVVHALATGGRVREALSMADALRARALGDALTLGGADSADLATPRSTDGPTDWLNSQTAIVLFVSGRGGVPGTAFTVTRDRVWSHALPPGDSILPLVQRTVAALAAPSDDTTTRAVQTRSAQQLGDLLLGPALANVPSAVQEVVVIPDGILNRVPFPALSVAGAPVLDRYAWSTAPSLHIARTLRTARGEHTNALRTSAVSAAPPPAAPAIPPATRRAAVRILADPAPPARAQGDADAAELWRVRLPGARREARAVQALFRDAELFIGNEATESQLRAARDDAQLRVLHIAAHAIVDDRTPDGGVIVLAADAQHDGFVSSGELSRLHLHEALVVLSGCRTARGPHMGDDGVRGLVPPLLSAGARVVVSTLWDVGDNGLAPVMERMYRELRTGATVAAAVATAQRWARAEGLTPRDWAGLAVIGDGSWQLPLELRDL